MAKQLGQSYMKPTQRCCSWLGTTHRSSTPQRIICPNIYPTLTDHPIKTKKTSWVQLRKQGGTQKQCSPVDSYT